MKKLTGGLLTMLCLVALVISGCATAAGPQVAAQAPISLYTDVQFPSQAMNNEVGTQQGEACASRILVFGSGDWDLKSAVDDAGVDRIGAVDTSYTNILGLYEQRCTVVSGN